MNKKIITVGLIALGLAACDFKNPSFKTSSVIQKNISISGNNETTITVNQKNFNTGTVSATGKGSVVIDNGKVFLGGRELDIDASKGANISYVNGKMTINGQEVKFKEGAESSNVEIKLTGKQIKVPMNEISELSSMFDIEQKCSDDNKNYLLIDENIKPYLSDSYVNGAINFKDGKYNIEDKLKIVLLTKPIESVNIDGTGNFTFNCVNKEMFSLNKSGIGEVKILNLNHKIVKINNDSVGKTILKGDKVEKLIVDNSGVGSISANIKIGYAHIENDGVGEINLDEVESIDAQNNGAGEINVNKTHNVLRAIRKGVGEINL